MNWTQLPWLEITLVLPLIGAVCVACIRDSVTAGRWTLAFTVATLGTSVIPWLLSLLAVPEPVWWSLFHLDALSAPLLPLLALLHVLTVLATPRVKMARFWLPGLLIGESIRLATIACIEPWPLIGFFAIGVIPPYLELLRRGQSTRVYGIFMLLFVVLLVAGQLGVDAGMGWASVALLLAVLVRSGTVPFHLWVPDLFERAAFGTALLSVTPLIGMIAAIRLVLPIAPDWVFSVIGIASLLTAVYAAGLAVVQQEARRFFAYLFLSHASLVLVGLELHTTISLTGALCLWYSVALSLGGLGLTLRALEARFGPLPLTGFLGLYEQSPALAVCFLLTGLGCVGFPGTLGFVAAELLVDGAIDANVFVGVTIVVAGALNGIAIVRAYLLLFTGTRHESSVPLGITPRERFAVLTLSALILGGGLFPQPGVANRHHVAEELLELRYKQVPEEPVPPAEFWEPELNAD